MLMTRSLRALAAIAAFVAALVVVPSAAAAQGGSDAQGSDDAPTSSEQSEQKTSSDSEDADGEKAESSDEQKKESAHGSYEWKRSYGFGLEYGQFYSGLNRWDKHLLNPNGAASFEGPPLHSFQLAAEISPVEGSRFTAFGGIESGFSSDPSVITAYGGLEPAFAFRRGPWSLGFGLAVGAGTVQLDSSQGSFSAGLVTLRPNLEVRRYFSESLAAYANIGFKQWLPFNADTSELDIVREQAAPEGDVQDLYEGSFHASVGFRFGHYPDHVKQVPDTDGDGLRDDIDDCPEKSEDEDGFEDKDGCPDDDNDGDGIADEQDECPDKAEDKNGYKDEDGCPDADSDPDGDGVTGSKDQCPDQAEDDDGYKDEDGCPDEDNDDDGIADSDDECPDEGGIELKDGCPSDRVALTADSLKLDSAIEFGGETSSKLTDDSQTVLRHAAQTLVLHTELESVRIDLYSHKETSDELAQKRVQRVLDFLVAEGVDAGRLTTSRPDDKLPSAPLKDGKSAKPSKATGVVILTVTQDSR